MVIEKSFGKFTNLNGNDVFTHNSPCQPNMGIIELASLLNRTFSLSFGYLYTIQFVCSQCTLIEIQRFLDTSMSFTIFQFDDNGEITMEKVAK